MIPSEKAALRNYRRRARYHQKLDRPKVFAGCDAPAQWSFNQRLNARDYDKVLADLNSPPSIPAYVRAWTIINHLKEE
jgi:hypothetical protein